MPDPGSLGRIKEGQQTHSLLAVHAPVLPKNEMGMSDRAYSKSEERAFTPERCAKFVLKLV